MKIAGEALVEAPVEQVWEALLDPAVLVRTIPGCERLETTGEHAYDMTVTAGVAAIRGTYSGSCRLGDLVAQESLTLTAQGAGAPGTISATVDVRFVDEGDGTTRLTYDADTVVGGMVGGVGQRMLTSVSRRMAAEFFGNVERVLTEEPAVQAAAVPQPSTPGVFSAPPAPAGASSQRDFLAGVAVGAGLVALGVVLGASVRRPRT